MSSSVDLGEPPAAVLAERERIRRLTSGEEEPSVAAGVVGSAGDGQPPGESPEVRFTGPPAAKVPVKLYVLGVKLSLKVLAVSVESMAVTLLTDASFELEIPHMTDLKLEYNGHTYSCFAAGGRFSFPEQRLYGICFPLSESKPI